MNLQQMEYIVAVDAHRHFLRAAERCHVTQATLSMMILKLEGELGVKIFDRSKQPVRPTETGLKIIAQARRILTETSRMKALVSEERGEVSGDLRLGVIPTLAPYLVPLFLDSFTSTYPAVRLTIHELTTADILLRLKSGELDAGLLATPLSDASILEKPLFYEKYFLYVNDKEKGFNKQYVLPGDIDVSRLWLLEEGHCMRSQILNFCELKKKLGAGGRIQYAAGSIETLKHLVERNFGITVLPELATLLLSKGQQKRLRLFRPPAPLREISLVMHRDFIRSKLLEALKTSVLEAIPDAMKQQRGRVLPV